MQDISQDAWHSLQPVLYRAQQGCTALWVQAVHSLQPTYSYLRNSDLAKPLVAHSQPLLAHLDAQLSQYRPWQVVLVSVLLAWTAVWLWQCCTSATASIREKGVKQTFFDFMKSLPIIHSIVQRETDKIIAKLRASMEEKEHTPGNEPMTSLPSQGTKPLDILSRLKHKEAKDVQFESQRSKVSGTLYLAGEDHLRLLSDAYAMFAHTNPMHSDVFPSVRRMESEVVNMTASLLGKGVVPSVCGAMTSGGTESILTAVKASRDYMCAKKGIRHPEMVVAQSAHAAFFKAAEYFKIRLIKVPVGRDYRLSPASVRRALTSNTVLVVCSSPGFPHGVMDPVPEIAAITRKWGVCLHSDACLGGFVLPFARKLGYDIPAFDFSVPGVTSMSTDTHKFGQAHKGTSVVLYRGPEIRRYQYTSITEWSGGLYISPGFAGSRSGALIASAWAALVHLGEEGYLAITRDIMQAADKLREGIGAIKGLEVVGDPKMSVIAFKTAKGGPDVYRLNDELSRRGWHYSALQLPPALHMCLTAAHVDSVPNMLQDIQHSMDELHKHPKNSKSGGMAPVYGMGAKSPDRGLIGEFLVAYQDVLLSGV